MYCYYRVDLQTSNTNKIYPPILEITYRERQRDSLDNTGSQFRPSRCVAYSAALLWCYFIVLKTVADFGYPSPVARPFLDGYPKLGFSWILLSEPELILYAFTPVIVADMGTDTLTFEVVYNMDLDEFWGNVQAMFSIAMVAVFGFWGLRVMNWQRRATR